MSLRRGIEPIIATVILVAVALIIAVAVVGYLMGLFGGLAGGSPQISITSVSARLEKEGSKDLEIELYINNAGAGSDKLIRAEVIYGNKTIKASMKDNQQKAEININIPGNHRGWVELEASGVGASVGDTVILKLYFERSGTHTINVVVNPPITSSQQSQQPDSGGNSQPGSGG
ncbi:MAG: archaellin/type IV pilin N-terminal domain-containing protein [Sulfolobales archaeon]